ncbi:MAG: cobalamin-dependent protein [Fibrobacteria bacterium]|nr:cobalamin-dependent protein [Fibrobacteria bacterium]
MVCEPLGLEYVAGVIGNQHCVKILDMILESSSLETVFKSFKPNIVGFSSLCIDVENIKVMASEIKKMAPGIATLVGGTQAFLQPGAFYHEAIDHVFKYTDSDNLTKVLNCIAANKPIPLIPGVHSRCNDYDVSDTNQHNAFFAPDREATAEYRHRYSYFGYRPCALLQTSMGCSNTCRFCVRWKIEGALEQDLPVTEVMSEIRRIKEPHIMIIDNNFLHDHSRIEALCDSLEKEKIHKKFICYASVKSIVAHPQSVERFAHNGFCAAIVGFESFKSSELDTYKKKTSVEDNDKARQILKNNQVDCWGSFILHPDWDKNDFKKFRKYMKELQPEVSTFSPLTPFPDTPLYREYQTRLLNPSTHGTGLDFASIAVRPSQMSIRAYHREIIKCNLYLSLRYSSSSYLLRRFGIVSTIRLCWFSFKLLIKYVHFPFQQTSVSGNG